MQKLDRKIKDMVFLLLFTNPNLSWLEATEWVDVKRRSFFYLKKEYLNRPLRNDKNLKQEYKPKALTIMRVLYDIISRNVNNMKPLTAREKLILERCEYYLKVRKFKPKGIKGREWLK